MTINNIITCLGIVIAAIASYYVYGKKKNKFNPGIFFLLLGSCFAIAAGIMYSIASICLFGFNKFILDFTYSDLTIPALVGSIGGTAATIYFIRRFLIKDNN